MVVLTVPCQTFEWEPFRLLQNSSCLPSAHEPPRALLILNQPLEHLSTLSTIWGYTSLHVAADGGANRLMDAQRCAMAQSISVPPFRELLHAIVGDLDSLSDEARNYFSHDTTSVIHNPDQDSTDFGKSVSYIRSLSAKSGNEPYDIVVMGGLGGRVDQGISLLHQLFMLQPGQSYTEGRLFLLTPDSLTFLLKPGLHSISVKGGDQEEVFDKYVGILPLAGPSVISTKGLEWDVDEWKTNFGHRVSTSNHVLPETKSIMVKTSNDVLFTIALKHDRQRPEQSSNNGMNHTCKA